MTANNQINSHQRILTWNASRQTLQKPDGKAFSMSCRLEVGSITENVWTRTTAMINICHVDSLGPARW